MHMHTHVLNMIITITLFLINWVNVQCTINMGNKLKKKIYKYNNILRQQLRSVIYEMKTESKMPYDVSNCSAQTLIIKET